MMQTSLLAVLRQWADGQLSLSLLPQHIQALPEAECRLGLTLLRAVQDPALETLRQLAQILSQRPDWLSADPHWQTSASLRQQLGRLFFNAATQLPAEPLLAQVLFQQTCLLLPHDLPAWQEGARMLLMLGKYPAALELIEQGLACLPGDFSLLLSHANVLQFLQRTAEAEVAYRKLLELAPLNAQDLAGIWNNLGQLCYQQGRIQEALDCFERTLQLNPAQIELWNNLAALYLTVGDLVHAEHCLNRCLEQQPGYFAAWCNRALLELGRGQAGKSRTCLQQALNLTANDPWILAALDPFEGALPSEQDLPAWQSLMQMLLLSRSLALKPQVERSRALMSAAFRPSFARRSRERLGAGERSFWDFLADLGVAEACIGQPLAERQAYLSHLARVLPDWAETPFGPEVYLQEIQFLQPEVLSSLIYLDAGSCAPLKRLLGQCFGPAGARPPVRKGQGPLRLGVVVTSRHESIFTKLGAAMFRALPASCCEVRLFGNPVALAATGLPCTPLPASLPLAADFLRQCELDLLYHWEIGSDTGNYLLPLFQTAPVQFTSWGVPATSGLPMIDYYVSSQVLETAASCQDYTEQLLLMPMLPSVSCDPLPLADHRTRQELGLNPGPLYVCIQNPLKFTPEFIALLCRILTADSEAQLVILVPKKPSLQATFARLLAPLKPFGQRVHRRYMVLPQAECLNLLLLADVVLDALVCSGGQTTIEALSLGRPVLTLPGPAQHSRLAQGAYKLLGIDDCVASDEEDYLQRAISLAHDPDRQARLRSQLLERRACLLDPEPAGEALAGLIWEMARREGLRS